VNLAMPTIIVISLITALLLPHELQCREHDRSSSDPAPQSVVPQSATSDHSKSKLQLEIEDLYGQILEAKRKESNPQEAVEKSENALQLAYQPEAGSSTDLSGKQEALANLVASAKNEEEAWQRAKETLEIAITNRGFARSKAVHALAAVGLASSKHESSVSQTNLANVTPVSLLESQDSSPKSVVQSGSHTSPPLKYSLTIFVDKGEGELNGHVFVKLSDGKNNLYFGFHANEAVTDEFGKATAAVRLGGGEIRDDAKLRRDVSRTYNITKSGFENALRAVEEIRKTGPSWWVNNHCGDFAEGVANAAGVPLHLPWTATGRDRPSIFAEYLIQHGGKQLAASNESKSRLQLEVEDLYGQTLEAKQKESNAQQAVEKSENALQLAYRLDDSEAKSIAQEALSISKEALAKDRQNRESFESKLHQACNKARAQLADIKANEGQQKTIEMCQKN